MTGAPYFEFLWVSEFLAEVWSGCKQVPKSYSLSNFRSKGTQGKSGELTSRRFTWSCLTMKKRWSTRRKLKWCAITVFDKQTIIFVQQEQIKSVFRRSYFQIFRHFCLPQLVSSCEWRHFVSTGYASADAVTTFDVASIESSWYKYTVFGIKISFRGFVLNCCNSPSCSHVVRLWKSFEKIQIGLLRWTERWVCIDNL